MAPRKVKVIGIDKAMLNEERLIEIMLKIEDTVRRFLSGVLPKHLDYNIVINVEENDVLSIAVDIEISSPDTSLINKFKPIVDDALSLAKRVWEEELERFKKAS